MLNRQKTNNMENITKIKLLCVFICILLAFWLEHSVAITTTFTCIIQAQFPQYFNLGPYRPTFYNKGWLKLTTEPHSTLQTHFDTSQTHFPQHRPNLIFADSLLTVQAHFDSLQYQFLLYKSTLTLHKPYFYYYYIKFNSYTS